MRQSALERQLHRLSHDKDPLYSPDAFTEASPYEEWKPKELFRLDDQMGRLKTRTSGMAAASIYLSALSAVDTLFAALPFGMALNRSWTRYLPCGSAPPSLRTFC